MLKYTGHPIVDVGVATITAYADVLTPEEVTEKDLADIADYMEQQYGKNPMRSFLTVIFPNSGFTQPAFDSRPEKRAAYANDVLRGWRQAPGETDDRCVFYGTPAVLRAFREMIPLIGAESGFNFYAEGASGLPVSGEALLAIQAFPLGCLKCSGRVLLIHADDPKLTRQFAANALTANRKFLSVSEQMDKYADTKHPKTQIINQLIAAEGARRDDARRSKRHPTSITAYHLTNYGTSAAVDLYHLPLQIMSFLWQATDAQYKQVWNRLVRRGWEGTTGGDDDTVERDELGLPAHRNVLYEDLFALPTDARRFLRTYLLRIPQVQGTTKDDQRRTYSLVTELDLVSWPLAQLFMKEVMNVDDARIEAIRGMADKIAKYVSESGDLRLFRLFLYGGNKGQDYQDLRTRLIRADYDVAPQGTPLFTFDEFIAAFENTDDRYWWLMARDLMLIRMIEQLASMGWINKHREAIIPPQTQDDEEQD
jgi:CRISPR-associated protein Cst1